MSFETVGMVVGPILILLLALYVLPRLGVGA